jgi:hypothetical protein
LLVREKNNPLLKQIQMKKEEMFACARETGYNSMETIVSSQELDKLIYEYQLIAQDKQEKANEKVQFRQLFWFLNQPKTAAGGFDS